MQIMKTYSNPNPGRKSGPVKPKDGPVSKKRGTAYSKAKAKAKASKY